MIAAPMYEHMKTQNWPPQVGTAVRVLVLERDETSASTYIFSGGAEGTRVFVNRTETGIEYEIAGTQKSPGRITKITIFGYDGTKWVKVKPDPGPEEDFDLEVGETAEYRDKLFRGTKVPVGQYTEVLVVLDTPGGPN